MVAYATPISALLYLAATISLILEIRNSLRRAEALQVDGNTMRMLAAAALLVQVLGLIQSAIATGAVDFSLSSMASLMCAVIVLLFLLGTLLYPIQRLGIILLPMVVLILVLTAFIGTDPIFGATPSTALISHVLVSVLAYSLLTLAAFQAVLITAQENQLHHRHTFSLMTMLPPAQTMDAVLFKLIGVGFGLLTLTLVTGMVFSQEIFGAPFAFTHHIVLSCAAWLIFTGLLFGRYRTGWRGRRAAHWTLWGFGILALGYFGTKIVMLIV
jgi:ABC-type uncharacterized transport system permease subunit